MSRAFQPITGGSPWPAVAVSATMGGVLGLFFTSTWQAAVETAQVLAGLVQYPPDNPFYRYHVSAWSLPHQVLALLLRLGVGERALSIALSGFLCAATFGGLTLCTYAVCRRAAVSILAPLVWFALFRDANAYGAVYPLVLTGTHHTNGLLGRAAALWLAGLTAFDCRRSALFLLPVLPALHLTWGLYASVVVGFAWLLTNGDWRRLLPHWPWFSGGLAVTVSSFALQRIWIASLPPVSAADAAPYLEAFLAHWDGHRIPTPLFAPGTALVLALGVVAGVLYTRAATSSARIMSTVMIAAATSGLALLLFAQFPTHLPQILTVAMPGRFANFGLLLFPALLLGLLGRLEGRAGAALLLLLIAYVFWNWFFDAFLSSDKYGWRLAHWKWLLPLLAGAALLEARARASSPLRYRDALAGVLVVIIASGVFLYPKGRVKNLFFHADDPVVIAARAREGLIITGPGLELMQLRTRRPILLNTGGLDQLPYVPTSGPAMHEALETVYGIGLLEPPAAIRERRVGALPRDAAVDVFAGRSLEAWQSIAQQFGDGRPMSVLVKPTHTLRIEPVAESDEWRLYDIPPAHLEE